MTVMKSDIEALQVENKGLKSELRRLDRKDRRNNMLIFDVPESTPECLGDVLVKLYQEVGLKFDPDQTHTMFRVGKAVGKRPILIEFISRRHKEHFFGERARLQSLGYGVAHDRSREDREERRRQYDQREWRSPRSDNRKIGTSAYGARKRSRSSEDQHRSFWTANGAGRSPKRSNSSNNKFNTRPNTSFKNKLAQFAFKNGSGSTSLGNARNTGNESS
ncbi:unnamed protein product [Nesidiocoris tenuis]|nr:unnamed protein product [Nesidiocoris tenuis]